MPDTISAAGDRIADYLERSTVKDDPDVAAEAVAFLRHVVNRLEILSDGYEDDWVWPQPAPDPAKSGAALRELLLNPEGRYPKAWSGSRPEDE
jgi:hypothetical protein